MVFPPAGTFWLWRTATIPVNLGGTVRPHPLRLCLLAALFATTLRAAPYEYWLTGNATDAQPARTRAGLMLAGGAGDVTAAWKWFLDCAGGGDIVVLRASGGDGYQDFILTKLGGVDSVETIKFNDASAARDDRVLKVIRQADGIFLAGGDQSRYVTWWRGTPVGDALNAHIRAGKPLGGTSAGLAVLGEFYFAALRDTVTSDVALRDPFDARVTIARDFISAPPLRGVLTDTHFMARKRLGRLIVFLARAAAEHSPSRLVGLGIDEGTALCVEPNGDARLFTEKSGLAWLVAPTRPPERLAPGEPLQQRGVQVIGIGPETRFNLTTLDVQKPAALQTVHATAGKLVEETNRP